MGSGDTQQHDGCDAEAGHCVIHMSKLDNGESGQEGQHDLANNCLSKTSSQDERQQDSSRQEPPSVIGVGNSNDSTLTDQGHKGDAQEMAIALETSSHECSMLSRIHVLVLSSFLDISLLETPYLVHGTASTH
ncbi:hypothetical protein BG011_003416 [Mortierella polycephala]|uniref:Uncharacterized protein n=1 Tax=Mortierella polycephala TaxID=41804 RepID=A0A9P6Q515_9FUNG|nr:hypothetical protein BG011_003416 [Mortierella polycephala]